MAVLQQMTIFALLILVGLYARNKKMINDENQTQISALVLRIAYPSIILSAALSDGPHIGGEELLLTVGVTILLLILLMVAAWLLPQLLGYEKKYYSIINVMMIFSNIGFMGVPMIDAIYGKTALIYMTIFLIPFNLLFFSYAIKTIRGNSTGQLFVWKDLLNEGMIACILTIIIYFTNIHIPYVIRVTVQMLGSMTAPLAMLLIGSFLSDMEWKAMFSDKRIWGFTLMKMLVIPVGIVMILEQFVDNRVLLAVCLAAIATPAGNVLALLAALYNKEVYTVSLRGIALTTIVSILTMPSVYILTGLD